MNTFNDDNFDLQSDTFLDSRHSFDLHSLTTLNPQSSINIDY